VLYDFNLFLHCPNSAKTGLQLLRRVLLEPVPREPRNKEQRDQGSQAGPASAHAAADPGSGRPHLQHRPLVDSHRQAQGVSRYSSFVVTFVSSPATLSLGPLFSWDHLERDGKKVDMAGKETFNRALTTWARWIDDNVDQSRTRVFFRSVSPEHKW
jgi:hypothetical protein